MSAAIRLKDELIRIGDVVTAAQGLVADGQLIDLDPLQTEITRICGEIGNVDAGDARMLQPVLLSLMDDLDRLAGIMAERQKEFEAELKSLSTHNLATRAYGRQEK